MRVLYVTTTMDVGGIETNLVNLGAEMRSRGHDVTVASVPGALVNELERVGIRHLPLSLSFRSPIRLTHAALQLKRNIERRRYDVVHIMSAAANLATLLAPRGGATRFVTSPMGLQMSATEPRALTLLRNRLLTLRADRILLISEEIRRQVEALGIDGHRLVQCDVVGIVPGRFAATDGEISAVRAELRLDDARVVTTIGALEPRKSHGLFLEAAALLHRRVPGTRFLVVGRGRERQRLIEQARKLGIGASVVFTGARRDIGAILGATSVYVKPGIVEGFIGITVLEAMAAGRPVVAFDTTDVRAAVVDGETGLIVARSDVGALALALERLLRDGVLASRLAAAGRARTAARFSIGAVASRLEKAYLESGGAG